jgi:fatty acid desaturase
MDEVFAAKGKAQVDPQVLRGLMKKSDLAGSVQLGSHLLALVVTGTLLWMAWGSWWGVPVFIVQGMLINWLYAAQHESSHDTVFRTRWMNEALGRFTGFMLMYPRDYDRWQHFCHHRHTQDPEKDGELVYVSMFNGRVAELLSLLGVTIWFGLGATMIRHAVTGKRVPVSEYYLSDEQEKKVVAEARWHLALYGLIALVSILLQTWAVVILWVAPVVLIAWTHQIQNYVEHGGMPYVPDTWRNTRTIKTNPLMRWLTWQMVHHTAHHTYPGVPFHNLSKLHAAIVEARGEQPVIATYFGHAAHELRAIFASKPQEPTANTAA